MRPLSMATTTNRKRSVSITLRLHNLNYFLLTLLTASHALCRIFLLIFSPPSGIQTV